MSAFGSTLPKLPSLPELPELPVIPELPSFAPPQIPTLPGLPGTPDRARHVDKLIASSRAKTPVDAVNKRVNPRLSIEELNQSDPDELRDRFFNSKYDTRTPLQQVLDLVDLPRNTIANLVFHDTAREQGAKGETAAFGMPRVSVSDGLRNMGVENRVALALGGFVGDVALDPLTYLGPAGWGVELGGTALRSGGKSLLKKAAKEAAAGGIESVSHPLAKGVLKAAGVNGAAPLEEINRLIRGDAADTLLQKAFVPLGGERTFEGGVFKKYAKSAKTAENAAEHESIDAIQNFIGQYGRGTGGGIKIGQGGSEIAHLPGTDLTLQVPAFTPYATRSLASLHLARQRDIASDLSKAESGRVSAVSLAKPIYDSMQKDMEMAHGAEALGSLDATDDVLRAENAGRFAAQMTERVEQMAQVLRDNPVDKITDLNANGILRLGEMYKEALAGRDLATAKHALATNMGDHEHLADAYSKVVDAAEKYRSIIGGTLSTHLDAKTKAASELVRQALGTDDAVLGTTLLGSVGGKLGNLFGEDHPFTRKLQDADRFMRNKFGLREGVYPRELADISHRRSAGANIVGAEVFHDFETRMNDLIGKAGLPATSRDDVGALASLYAYQAAAARLGKPLENALFLKRAVNGKLVDGELTTRMNSLMAAMKQAGVGPEFHAGLKQLASESAERLATFGDKESSAYMLNRMMDFYIPNMTRMDTKGSLQAKRGGGMAFESHAVSDQPTPRQAHQIQRTSNIYQFQDETGYWHEFTQMEMDRATATGPLELEKIRRDNPAGAKVIEDIQAKVKMYEALGENAPPPRPADFFEANKMAAEGRFGHLSIEPTKDFFETSLPLWLGQRAAAHERTMANAELVKFMGKVGIMNSDKFLSIVKRAGTSAESLTMPTGEKVSIRTVMGRFGEPTPILYARGSAYRPLSQAMSKFADNPMIAPIYNAGKDLVLPEKLADKIEDMAVALKDENMHGILAAAEKATGIFRGLTLFHPSWTIYDVVGNLLNAASGDIDISKMIAHLPEAFRVKRAELNPHLVESLVTKTATGELRGHDAIDFYKKAGSLDRNMPANIGAGMTMAGVTGLPSQFRRVGVIPDLSTDHAYNMARWSGALGKPGAAAASGLHLGWDRINRHAIGPWIKANSFVNDVMRTAAHMALMEQGHDAASATDKMRRALFDYHDLTYFERKYMRTLFPFYSWMRNNLPYQMKQLFQRPSYLAAAPKVQRAIEEAIAGEQQVPMGLRPSWMRNALATQIGDNPESRFAYLVGNSTPQTELLNVLQGAVGMHGAQEALHYFGSSLNPIISAPLQIGGGQEYFSGRQIGEEGMGDITIPEFVTGLVRPIAEVGKISDAAARSPVEGVARALVGGRVQNFGQRRLETSKARELRDQIEGYRRTITKAESRGNHAQSVRSRAKLLRVYEEAIRLGLDKDVQVPKWAKTALEGMAGGVNGR